MRIGRSVALVLFGCAVAAITAMWSLQICLQVWAPDKPRTTATCAEGLAVLIDGIAAARRAAANPLHEDSALAEFRRTIAPYWTIRPALDPLCDKNPDFAGKLEEVDRLRYAEEHAVRYFARDLSQGRRSIALLRARLPREPTPQPPQ